MIIFLVGIKMKQKYLARFFTLLGVLIVTLGNSFAQTLYASGWPSNDSDADSALYVIQNPLTDPTASVVGYMGFPVTDLAINSSGAAYAIRDEGVEGSEPDALYSVDLSTGATTYYMNLGIENANGLGFDSQGNLWMVGYLDENLYKIDLSTKTVDIYATASVQIANDIAASPDGQNLIMESATGIVEFNLTTNTFSYLGGNAGEIGFGGLAFVGDQLVGTTSSDNGVGAQSLYAISTSTGQATEIGVVGNTSQLGCNGLATAAPEPTSLLALSFVVIGLGRRPLRKNRAMAKAN